MIDHQSQPPPMSLALAMLPVLVLLAAIGAGVPTLGFSGDILLISILFAAVVAGLVCRQRGIGWDAIQAETGRQIAEALPALLILLSIGALLGSWMFSGTIPLMVMVGIDLIDPRFMALTAFIVTAGMSLISGTSWGSAGTIGVAMMGAAAAMGVPLAPVAGAVVSGAYLGDKLSPLSDMTNITAIAANAELYSHIRHMMWTSIGPAAAAIIVFTVAGLALDIGGETQLASVLSTKTALAAIYTGGFLPAIPLAVAVAGIALRYPAALVIMASAVIALVIGVTVQGFSASAAVSTIINGFDVSQVSGVTPDTAIASLLNRGGLFSMAPTLIFIFAAFLLAAAMRVSGALDRLLAALLSRVRSAFGLIGATMAAGMTMVGITSHGGVTALIVGGLFRPSYAERGLAPENLSRSLADSITVTEPLMPWTVSGLFMATTLGVATVDLAPWAVFCWLCPVASLTLAALYSASGRGLKPLESAAPN